MYRSYTLQEWAGTVHQLAQEKGWHAEEESEDAFIERACNNLHDEVSELHEAWRNNRLHSLCDKVAEMTRVDIPPLTYLEEEMADIIIRTLDACERLGIDIQKAIISKHKYNSRRPIRHGGKKS